MRRPPPCHATSWCVLAHQDQRALALHGSHVPSPAKEVHMHAHLCSLKLLVLIDHDC